MAQKVLTLNAQGRTAEVEANIASAGAGDAGKLVALDGTGKIDPTMLPESDSRSVTFTEAAAAGKLINYWNDGGTVKARLADASNDRAANGYAPSAVGLGAAGTVSHDGVISGLAGLTLGARYFLGTNGAVTDTVPTTSGHILQYIGKAISATEILTEFGDAIPRA